MTTLDFSPTDAAPTERTSIFAGLKAMWLRFKQRRRTARAIQELSQLDARLLRDIGIEPLDVYDALNGRTRALLFNPIRRSERD